MGLAGVMTVGMCVPVLADTTVNATDGTGGADVTYIEPEAFSVTIPSTITMNKEDSTKTINITVDNSTLKLASGKKVKITSNLDALNTLEMTEKTATTVKVNANITPPSSDKNFFDLTHNVPVTYTVAKPTSVDYAGEYTGTITFTVTLE